MNFNVGSDTKTVIITGGVRGIGRAASIRFAANGWLVIAGYQSRSDAALSLRTGTTSYSGRIVTVEADIADSEGREKLVKRALELTGRVDALVNNAAISEFGLFSDISPEREKRLFDVNLFAPMNLTRLVIPHMLHRKSGAIVNVSSMWGQVGASCEVQYSTAKAGLIGFTKALAKELAPSGIRVNCVAPGMIVTDMNSRLTKEERDAFADEIPMCRAGLPDEVAECIYFLSASGSYVTGQVLSPNGGYVT